MSDHKNDLNFLTTEVENNPNNHMAWYDLATLVDSLADDAEEAAYYYTRAISLAPFTLHYHVGLVTLWVDRANAGLAEETLNFAIDLLRDPDDLDNSNLFSLCAEAALHALHATDLDLAKVIIEKVRPDDIKKSKDLMKILLAYSELHMMELETESNLHSSRRLINVPQLPSTRLNPARYNKQKET